MTPSARHWQAQNPLARILHDLAQLEALTAQSNDVDGRRLTTIVGFREGLPVFTSTFGRECGPGAPYDGA